MARINIDKYFFVDERIDALSELCGEHRFMTEGRILRVWAACYNAISEFRTLEEIDMAARWLRDTSFANLMARVKLATKTPDGNFRIAGVDDRIEYLREAAANGKKSAEARRKKYGNAKPQKPEGKPKVPSRSEPENDSRRSVEGLSKVPSQTSEGTSKQPSTAPEPPAPPHSLKNTRSTNVDLGAQVALPGLDVKSNLPARSVPKPPKVVSDPSKIQAFIGAYVVAFGERYPDNARPGCLNDPACLGQIKRFLSGNLSLDKAVNLIQCYLQMDGANKWFAKKHHDFQTFLNNLNEVEIALTSGKDPSRPKTSAEEMESWKFDERGNAIL